MYSRWGFAGGAYNFCFSIVSLAKKIAFSLWIHSKTDGLLHSRCSLAVVALKIRIFSALDKGCFAFQAFDVAFLIICILARVLQGLTIISAVQLFRRQKNIAFSLRIHSKTDGLLHSRCSLAVVAIKIRIFSALDKGCFAFQEIDWQSIIGFSTGGKTGGAYNYTFSIVSLVQKIALRCCGSIANFGWDLALSLQFFRGCNL